MRKRKDKPGNQLYSYIIILMMVASAYLQILLSVFGESGGPVDGRSLQDWIIDVDDNVYRSNEDRIER